MAPSQEAFAKKMTRALRRAGAPDGLRYDAERFALVTPDAGSYFLSSVFQLYSKTSFWRRGAVLKQHAQALLSTAQNALPKTFDEARANLVPVVRDAAFLDVAVLLAHTARNKAPDRPPAHFAPLAGALCYGLAFDTPQTIAIFSAQQLADWGVSFDDAMKAARYNLSVRSRDPMRQIAPGLFMAPWQDANAAGRLLLTELLTRLPVKGDVVAAVPGRDFLLVAGSEDPDALGAMVLAAEKAVQQPKSNCPELLRLQGTGWVPFTLAADHPLATRHRELLEGSISAGYAGQKKLIEQVNAKSGIDMFVANYSAMKRPGGEIYSWCSWAPCVSLLPRTELVMIFAAGADLAAGKDKPTAVKWEDAVAVVGHKMKRQAGYRLERYLVEESPSDDEMAALRERALTL